MEIIKSILTAYKSMKITEIKQLFSLWDDYNQYERIEHLAKLIAYYNSNFLDYKIIDSSGVLIDSFDLDFNSLDPIGIIVYGDTYKYSMLFADFKILYHKYGQMERIGNSKKITVKMNNTYDLLIKFPNGTVFRLANGYLAFLEHKHLKKKSKFEYGYGGISYDSLPHKFKLVFELAMLNINTSGFKPFIRFDKTHNYMQYKFKDLKLFAMNNSLNKKNIELTEFLYSKV